MATDKSHKIKELHTKGTELFEDGKLAEAQELFVALIDINPNFADVLNKLGYIASMDDDLYKAVMYFNRALEINPTYTEASLNLTITLNDLGEVEKAQQEIERLSKTTGVTEGQLDPFVAGKIANEHFKLGNLYTDFNRVDDAILEYRKALSLKGGLVDIRTALAESLRKKGQYDDALSELHSVLDDNKHYAPAWVQLGLTFQMMGNKAKAIEVWKTALKHNPNLKEAKSFLKIIEGEG
jgi:tetratricopeptide (TPR) repeat protein